MAHTWNRMMVIQEMLAMMNKGGNSQDDEERIRRIMRDVMRETTNASASERDMMHRMMQLMEHNVTKHSAELQATAQERDHYKAKMEELNRRMEELMRDGGGPPSGGEGPGLTDKQKRLAEMWEELKEMRRSKHGSRNPPDDFSSSQFTPEEREAIKSVLKQREMEKAAAECTGKSGSQPLPVNPSKTAVKKKKEQKEPRGAAAIGSRNPPNDFSSSQVTPEERDAFKLVLKQREAAAAECTGKSGSQPLLVNPSKTAVKKKKEQKEPKGAGAMKSGSQPLLVNPSKTAVKKKKEQKEPKGAAAIFDSGSTNPRDDFSSSQFTPEEIEEIKSVLKQREIEKAAAECTGKSGSQPFLVNPSKMAVKEMKEQKEPKGAAAVSDSGSRNPPDDFSSSQFTPDKIEAIKSVLMQREAAAAECTGKSGSQPFLVNPSKMAVKKEKEQKEPEGAAAIFLSSSRKPPGNLSSSQFTPEEIEAIKSVLKQREAAAATECTGKSVSQPLPLNPSKKAVKKEKEQKEPEGAAAISDIGSRNPPDDFSSSQFTPEKIAAIKSVLKQREAAAAECAGKSGSQPLPVNPSKKAVKKEKEQKEPEGVAAVFYRGSKNPRDDFSSSQFTPEEIEAIKSVLKQRKTAAVAAAECTGKSGSQPLPVNPSKKAVKKEEQKEPEGAAAVFDSGSRNPRDDFSSSQFTPEEIEAIKSVLKQRKAAAAECAGLPDDSESDDEDASEKLSGDAGETGFAKATDAKLLADSKKKKKRNKNKGSKDQAAAQQKPEGLSPLEVFTASGFDMSQIADLNMDQAVNDLMLITKEDGNIVSCQPKTVRQLVEFKQQYPNAQAIIVKTSEQQ